MINWLSNICWNPPNSNCKQNNKIIVCELIEIGQFRSDNNLLEECILFEATYFVITHMHIFIVVVFKPNWKSYRQRYS